MTIYKGTVPIAGLAKNTIVNGFHIFDCKWADHLLEDISWLRADTFSWQSGSVYVTAYNELVSEYNNASSTTETEGSITFKRTPKGYKIADVSQETDILNKYNTDGIAWYYILDTTNTQFKLPRTKFGFEGLRTNVGDDIAESLPQHKHYEFVSTSRGSSADSRDYQQLYSNMQVSSLWYSGYAAYNLARNSEAADVGLSSNAINSTYQDNAPVQERATQMYLYFYVGEYAQTAIEQTAGITSEQLNNKLDANHGNDTKPYLKTTYVNGTSGYRIWSDGYCEQWGYFKFSLSPQIITLTKTYQNIDYNICVSFGWNSNYTNDAGSINSNDKTVSSFKVYAQANNTTYAYCYWRAYGYLAEGEY